MKNIFPEYAERLCGTWSLLSYAVYTDKEEKSVVYKPHGDCPSGKIVLTSSGYVSAILLPPERKTTIPEDDLRRVPDDEVLVLARSLAAYCGPIRLYHDGPDLVWTCDVELANNPNWVGKPQTRAVELVGMAEDGKELMVLRPRKDYVLSVSNSNQTCTATAMIR